MSATLLKQTLADLTKAELQSWYLYWFPSDRLVSCKDELRQNLFVAMTDACLVRERFENLSRSHQGFLVALLLAGDSFCTSIDELRQDRQVSSLEDYEIEAILKTLRAAGYVVQPRRQPGNSSPRVAIPSELAQTLRSSIRLEERDPMQMLSRTGRAPPAPETESGADETEIAASLNERLDAIPNAHLRKLTSAALDNGGILTLSQCKAELDGDGTLSTGGGFCHDGWRTELESRSLGTTGFVSLKNYGLDLDEQAVVIYQELICDYCFDRAAESFDENDSEVSLGVDLIIDLDRLPSLLAAENAVFTRAGTVYKKVEDRLGPKLTIAHHQELVTSPVSLLVGLAKRIRWLEREGQRPTFDNIRIRAWRGKSLPEKLRVVFDAHVNDQTGERWSFHQRRLREIFLAELARNGVGQWLVVKSLVDGVIARYLLDLEDGDVRALYEKVRQDNFTNRKLVVSLGELRQDLAYWLLHRLAVVGFVDVGFRGGAFYSLRLSRLGAAILELDQLPELGDGPQLIVNPDFEILVFPEAPDEWNWSVSQFADRLESGYVKRYELSRESVKRALATGWSSQRIGDFLQQHAFGVVPPNVIFSLREWTQGVEIVRRRKVLLLHSQTKSGTDRISKVLARHDLPFDRLGERYIAIQGVKNAKRLSDIGDELKDWGLILE